MVAAVTVSSGLLVTIVLVLAAIALVLYIVRRL